MLNSILSKAELALEQSTFLRDVAESRRDRGRALAIRHEDVRPLTDREISLLERQGNRADEWSRVQVVDGFDGRRVQDSRFHGDVVLGRFSGTVHFGGKDHGAGIYRSTIIDCAIGHGSLISDVRLLADCCIGPKAVLFDCGRIVCSGSTTFGVGQLLPLGLEGSGRDVAIYAEIDVEVAAAVAGCRRRDFQERYAELVRRYKGLARATKNLIGAEAVICQTTRVEDVYLGPGGRIDGALQVVDSVVLSSIGEPTAIVSGASVNSSIIQWGSRVSGMAMVDRAVLTEYSGAERQGKVCDSLIGPNTIIAQGEVAASLVGPLVGFHHQALLIAAFWPEGRGNVAAGALVGSNHTCRAPDQEFRPGEGAFLGLGAKIKYPSDFSRSPYIVVACGVTTQPQRVAFPFALIAPQSDHRAPPGYNQIIPAWLLSDSLYAVARNEAKFRTRYQARRAPLNAEILRPDVVDLMLDACERLEDIPERKEIYTEHDIAGLGKNYLLEEHRERALATYRFFVCYAALRRLCSLVEESKGNDASDAAHHLFQDLVRGVDLICDSRCGDVELFATSEPSTAAKLKAILQEVAESVERSKAKDDTRGRRIINDYAESHLPVADDPVVQNARSEIERMCRNLDDWIAPLLRRSKKASRIEPATTVAAKVG